MSDSLRYHQLQHARCFCPSLSPGICSNSPLHQWWYLTISSSATHTSSCPQSFAASGSFPMSQLFTSDGQNIGASALASVLPKNIQDWFPLRLTGLISLQSKGLSGVFSSTMVWKNRFFHTLPSLWSNFHIHTWLLEKTIALTFVRKVMSLLFNMLSSFVIDFLPRSKCLLISWLQSPSIVILEPRKIKSVTVSIISPSICHEVMGPNAMILVYWMLSFKPAFSLSSFTLIKRLFQSVSQFSHSVMSDSLRPHGLQHARLPCTSPTPRVYSKSCPSSQWCHPTMPSSSVVSFSSCFQSFPASGSFQMSQFFALGGQSIGVSTSASVLPMNIQSWFP